MSLCEQGPCLDFTCAIQGRGLSLMSAQSPRAYTLFVGSPITCRFLSVRIYNIIFHFSLGGLDPAILPLLDYFYVYEGLYNSWTCTCPFLFLSTPRDLTNWVGDSPVLHTTNPQGRSSPLLSFTQSDVTSLKTVIQSLHTLKVNLY